MTPILTESEWIKVLMEINNPPVGEYYVSDDIEATWALDRLVSQEVKSTQAAQVILQNPK